MKTEQLWRGRIALRQEPGVFPLSMDTMALADFATLRPRDRVLDLGCGSGALELLLWGRSEFSFCTAVDCDGAACRLARRNFAENSIPGTVIESRAAEVTLPRGERCTLAVCNPPYYPPGRGKPGTAARTGGELREFVEAAGRCVTPGGRLALVYPAGELETLVTELHRAGFALKRLRPAAHCPGKKPKIVLAEAVLGGRIGAEFLPTLYWFREDGTPTEDYRRIYHDTAPSQETD